MEDQPNEGDEFDIIEEQYSFGDEEEDKVILEKSNNKKGAILHNIKSKLKIIQYVKRTFTKE